MLRNHRYNDPAMLKRNLIRYWKVRADKVYYDMEALMNPGAVGAVGFMKDVMGKQGTIREPR